MQTKDYVEYLQAIEDLDGARAWDNEAHAAKNLETVFGLHPEYAASIVKIANISTLANIREVEL